MKAPTAGDTTLAYEERGAGFPGVFVHGLSFSNSTWRRIIYRLSDRFRCVAIDLPGHGESKGPPRSMDQTAGEILRLITDLGITRPVVVGHSMAALTVTVYAAQYPVAGVVNVDQPLDVEPFARMLRQMEHALRGSNFPAVFEPIRRSIGVELLPEPLRSDTLNTQTVRQDLVLGYWDEALQRSPEDLQSLTDEAAGKINVPYLAVFGRTLADDERNRLTARLPILELEEWPDRGHMVHLMDSERFADRLAAFIALCGAAS